MTVGSDVKGCFAAIKGAQATLDILTQQTQQEDAVKAYKQASSLLDGVRTDLETHVLFLMREETQYKS